MSPWRSLALLLLFASVLSSGCGPRFPATAPVSGHVTYQGKPITQGRVVFYPAAGVMGQGEIRSDGAYTLTTFRPNDGAVLGQHRVVIIATRVTGPPQPKSFDEELKSGGGGGTLPADKSNLEWLVPETYSERETSPLTAEVEPGQNTHDFDLK